MPICNLVPRAFFPFFKGKSPKNKVGLFGYGYRYFLYICFKKICVVFVPSPEGMIGI